jgi:hypothetical protein
MMYRYRSQPNFTFQCVVVIVAQLTYHVAWPNLARNYVLHQECKGAYIERLNMYSTLDYYVILPSKRGLYFSWNILMTSEYDVPGSKIGEPSNHSTLGPNLEFVVQWECYSTLL